MTVQPVGRNTRGVGFTQHEVWVDHLVPYMMLAVCKEVSTGRSIEVSVLPVRVRLPKVGEKWLIDRLYSTWSFAALLYSEDIFEVGQETPYIGPTEPPGDASTWRIGQRWVQQPVKYWNGTDWSTTAP